MRMPEALLPVPSDLFADEPGVTAMGSVGIYSQDPSASPSITSDFGGRKSEI